MLKYREFINSIKYNKNHNIIEYKIKIMRPYLNIMRENVLIRLRKGKKGRPQKISTNNIRDDINTIRDNELKRVRKELSKIGRPKLIHNCLEEEVYNEYIKKML